MPSTISGLGNGGPADLDRLVRKSGEDGSSTLVWCTCFSSPRSAKEKAVTPACACVAASVYAVNRCRPLRPNFGATGPAIQLRAKLDFPGCDLRDHWQSVLDFQSFNFPVTQLGARLHEP